MICFVRLPFFFLDDPEEPKLVLRNRQVICAGLPALRRGVRPGMNLTTARTLFSEAKTAEWKLEDRQQDQWAWLDLCTTVTDVIEPIDQHECYLDLSRHPYPQELLGQLKSLLPMSVLGVGRVKWMAKLAAEILVPPPGVAANLQAFDSPEEFLYPLDTDHLDTIDPQVRKTLKHLGYRTIGQVQRLPVDLLKAQFARDAWKIYQASRGQGAAPVRALYPQGSIRDRFYFPEPIDQREPLELALTRVANWLSDRLASAGMCSTEAWLSLELEEAPLYRRERTFTRPVQSWHQCEVALRSMLPAEIRKRVLKVQAGFDRLMPVTHYQKCFIDSLPAERDASGEAAMNRLKKVYGSQVIKRASEVEFPRRIRILQVWKHATGWF